MNERTERTLLKQGRKHARLSSFFSETRSKAVQVAAAVAGQLEADDRWPPNNLTKKMGDDYNYDRNTLGNFLRGVEHRLERGDPSYNFEFNSAFVLQALGLTVAALMAEIDARTS